MDYLLLKTLVFTLTLGLVVSRTCDRLGAISGCATNCNVGTEDVDDNGACGSRRCCRTNCAGPRTFCIGIRQSCENAGDGFDEVDGTCPDDDNFICCAPRGAPPLDPGPPPYQAPPPPYETTPPPPAVDYTTTPAPPPALETTPAPAPAPEAPATAAPPPQTPPSPQEKASPQPQTPPKQPPPTASPQQDDQEDPNQPQPPPGKNSKKYHKTKKVKTKGKKAKNLKKKAKVGKGKKKSKE